MIINIDFVKQFSDFGAILAGFAMTIALRSYLYKEDGPESLWNELAGASFLVSSVILLLGVYFAALVISMDGANIHTQAVLSGPNIVFNLTVFGGLFLLIGIALLGFIKSKTLGAITTGLSLVTMVTALILFSYIRG